MATRTISPTGTKAITDAVTSAGLTSCTSVLGLFTSSMVGDSITGTDIPVGTTISGFTSANAVTMSQAATGAATGVVVTARGYASSVMWEEDAVPTAADDVVARGDGTSANLTIGAAAACRSADFSNYTGILTHNAFTWSIGTTTANGTTALKFVPGMTYTPSSASALINFVSTSVTQLSITTAGKTMGAIQFNGVNGSWILADSLTLSPTLSTNVTIIAGTVNTDGKAISCNRFILTNGTKVLTLGASQITAASTSPLSVSGAGHTITANTATFTTTSNSTLTVTLGSVNFNGMALVIGGTGNVTFSTAGGTLGSLTIISATDVARIVTFFATGTFTFTTLTLTGRSGFLITIVSSSSGSAANISVASGNVTATYVSLKDSAAAGGATFRAVNSIDVSGNSGWQFNNHTGRTLNDLQTAVLSTLYPNLSLSDMLMRYWADNGGRRTNDALVTYYGGPSSTKSLNDLAYDFWLALV